MRGFMIQKFIFSDTSHKCVVYICLKNRADIYPYWSICTVDLCSKHDPESLCQVVHDIYRVVKNLDLMVFVRYMKIRCKRLVNCKLY